MIVFVWMEGCGQLCPLEEGAVQNKTCLMNYDYSNLQLCQILYGRGQH
jgi:hypothetical protein